MYPISQQALEARARRAARRLDLRAVKSRRRVDSLRNFGEFMLLDVRGNFVVAGSQYDMTAEEVLAYCADD